MDETQPESRCHCRPGCVGLQRYRGAGRGDHPPYQRRMAFVSVEGRAASRLRVAHRHRCLRAGRCRCRVRLLPLEPTPSRVKPALRAAPLRGALDRAGRRTKNHQPKIRKGATTREQPETGTEPPFQTNLRKTLDTTARQQAHARSVQRGIAAVQGRRQIRPNHRRCPGRQVQRAEVAQRRLSGQIAPRTFVDYHQQKKGVENDSR